MKLLIFSNDRYRRIAKVDRDNNIFFYFEEFLNNQSIKGNVYLGKIVRLENNLNAAFVDIGMPKLGFLNLNSIHPMYFQTDEQEKIINKILNKDPKKFFDRNKINITKVLSLGQILPVQVIRTEHNTKGPMLSSFLNLKYENFKYMPISIDHKVMAPRDSNFPFTEEIFQNNFNSMGTFFVQPESTKKQITKAANVLLSYWRKINSKKNQVGDLIYKENKFEQIIENQTDIEEIITENYYYKNAHQGFNIFKDYESQIEEIHNSKIDLECKGFLIFEQTESGCNIDVNLGKNDNNNYRKSILETNLNAVKTIFRQINLRNIGGKIIVDFIGMTNKEDIKDVENAVNIEIQKQKVKMDFTNISKFGIMELCRQYDQWSLPLVNCLSCSQGKVPTIGFIGEKILRQLNYLSEEKEKIEVHISKEIGEYFLNYAISDIIALKNNLKTEINFIIINHNDQNYFQIYSDFEWE